MKNWKNKIELFRNARRPFTGRSPLSATFVWHSYSATVERARASIVDFPSISLPRFHQLAKSQVFVVSPSFSAKVDFSLRFNNGAQQTEHRQSRPCRQKSPHEVCIFLQSISQMTYVNSRALFLDFFADIDGCKCFRNFSLLGLICASLEHEIPNMERCMDKIEIVWFEKIGVTIVVFECMRFSVIIESFESIFMEKMELRLRYIGRGEFLQAVCPTSWIYSFKRKECRYFLNLWLLLKNGIFLCGKYWQCTFWRFSYVGSTCWRENYSCPRRTCEYLYKSVLFWDII